MRHKRRHVRNGDTYSIDENEADYELEVVGAVETIPIEIQGEPWGWTKGPPYPLDYGREFPE